MACQGFCWQVRSGENWRLKLTCPVTALEPVPSPRSWCIHCMPDSRWARFWWHSELSFYYFVWKTSPTLSALTVGMTSFLLSTTSVCTGVFTVFSSRGMMQFLIFPIFLVKKWIQTRFGAMKSLIFEIRTTPLKPSSISWSKIGFYDHFLKQFFQKKST